MVEHEKLDSFLKQLENDPEDKSAQQGAIQIIARLDFLERDFYTHKLYQVLKKINVKKASLEEAIKQRTMEDEDGEVGKSDQELLLELADEAEVFCNEHGEHFARVYVDDHHEVWPIGRSKDFRLWLISRFFDLTQKGPAQRDLNLVLEIVKAKAWRSKVKYKLHLKSAWHKGCIYYDLANEKWEAVRINPEGWNIVSEPAILFRRYSHMLQQPNPDPHGDVKKILEFVNIEDEGQQILFLCSLISDLVPDIPHAIKVFYGQQGSTKSTASKITRSIIDPSSALTCRSYSDRKEFVQYLAHNYYCVIDNLSAINPKLSDTICSAVTGDGDAKRTLYTDEGDTIFVFKRSFIMNGINNVVLRPDLLRRSLLFGLEPPESHKRVEEIALWNNFEKARAYILGGILNALSSAMKIYPSIKFTGLYDMADFTHWGAAIAEVLGYGAEKFLKAYHENKLQQTNEAIANNAVAASLKLFMNNKKDWSGTASELLGHLEQVAIDEKINTKGKNWPQAANSLSRRLNEFKTALNQAGIEIINDRDNTQDRTRMIKISVNENIVQTVRSVLPIGN